MDKAKKPNVKAPRAKPSVGYCPVNISYWRKFKKDTGCECTYKEFSEIIRLGNSLIVDVVANERDGFKLLNNIGTLMVISYEPPKYKQTFDYTRVHIDGLKVNHHNWDTDMKVCKILYHTYDVKDMFANRKLWRFMPVRQFSRTVSARFKEQHEIYKEISHFENISALYKKETKISKEINQEKDYFKEE